jgi:hypothetical protein
MAIATSTAIALGLAALSAGASAYNTNQVAKGQDRQAAAGIAKQAENQRAVNERINKTLQFEKAKNPDEVKNVVTDQFLDRLRAKRAQALTSVDGGGLSSAYDKAVAAAGSGVTSDAATTAGQLAGIDAPLLQRQQEGQRYGDLGMDLDVFGRNVQGDQFLNNLRMRGIRRNPWIDAGAAALGGASSGMMAGAGGASGGAQYGTIAPVAYQNNTPWALPRYGG